MEEIVTVDGRQYKLTTDRPLTAEQKTQTIAEIRKQSGCGTCYQPRTLSTGGVYSLPMDPGITGTGVGGKGTGAGQDSLVTLKASPAGGVRPYTVRFWYSPTGVTPTSVGALATHTTLATDPEGTTVTDTYTLVDADIAAAVGNGTAGTPSAVNTTTGAITLGGTAAALAAGSIRFYASVVDSCPGTDKGTCAQYADVATVCVAPTCSFVVT